MEQEIKDALNQAIGKQLNEIHEIIKGNELLKGLELAEIKFIEPVEASKKNKALDQGSRAEYLDAKKNITGWICRDAYGRVYFC